MVPIGLDPQFGAIGQQLAPAGQQIGTADLLLCRYRLVGRAAVEIALELVVDEDHDHVGSLGCLGHTDDLEAIRNRLLRGLSGAQTNDDIHPGITKILRMGMPLASVSDYREGLTPQHVQRCIVFVVNFYCH